jgi:hypothetical protein
MKVQVRQAKHVKARALLFYGHFLTHSVHLYIIHINICVDIHTKRN